MCNGGGGGGFDGCVMVVLVVLGCLLVIEFGDNVGYGGCNNDKDK